MIYSMLCAIASGLYAIIWSVWYIEELLIRFMMNSFLLAMGFICHPITLIPMLIGVYWLVRKFLQRRAADAAAVHVADFKPRYRDYRKIDSLSPRNSQQS